MVWVTLAFYQRKHWLTVSQRILNGGPHWLIEKEVKVFSLSAQAKPFWQMRAFCGKQHKTQAVTCLRKAWRRTGSRIFEKAKTKHNKRIFGILLWNSHSFLLFHSPLTIFELTTQIVFAVGMFCDFIINFFYICIVTYTVSLPLFLSLF